MKEVALLTLHGMGDTKRSYANQLFKKVRQLIGASNVRKTHFDAIYYQDILQRNQEVVWRKMRSENSTP